jgi:hypothetical protein
MRQATFAMGVLLLSIVAASNIASASDLPVDEPVAVDGPLCGAWEPLPGGTTFRRGCSEGVLFWWEYKTIPPPR